MPSNELSQDNVAQKRHEAVCVLEDVENHLRQARYKLQDYPDGTIQTPYRLLLASIEHSQNLAFAGKEILKGRL